MERRDVIARSIANMHAVFKDVSRIMGIVEQQMDNLGFAALGDAAVRWETSAALSQWESWLPTYAGRCYRHKKGTGNLAVGYCVHIGGYGEEFLEELEPLGLNDRFPFVNASLLTLDKSLEDHKRPQVLNALWGAGWHYHKKSPGGRVCERNCLVRSRTCECPSESITYFLDLLDLSSEGIIRTLLTEPLVKMHSGQKDWIMTNNVRVLDIR